MVQMPSPTGGPPADMTATGPAESSPSPVPASTVLPPQDPPELAPPAMPEPAAGPSEPTPPAAPPEPAADSSSPRTVGGIVLGAVAAAFGGWILGEYPFTGVMPYITGVLFALVVAEIMLSISRRSGWAIGIAASLASLGGIGLAVWIQSTEGLVAVPIGGWMAIAIGGVVALLRCGLRMGAPRATGN